MDVLHNLALGFEVALSWQNLMYCAIGCTVGTLVGLLPGLGPLATISILLPLTYSIPTGGALIMFDSDANKLYFVAAAPSPIASSTTAEKAA